MKILITGKNGQVGYELERSLQNLGEVIALDRKQMDLSNLEQVRDVIRTIKPNLIINAAAYTAVDKAESEPELAMCINGLAPGVMAEEAKKLGAAMIHYSTDYVFDGNQRTPYLETDITNPINVYGATKLAGEQAIQRMHIPYLIFRTSWVYGMRGGNFLLTVLRLAKERDKASIVNDQYGSPTWCRTIADATGAILAKSQFGLNEQEWWQGHSGIYHLTGQGQTTWFGFAEAILKHAAIKKSFIVKPITADEYPLLANRPKYSVMSSEKIINSLCAVPEWEHALKLCLAQ
ncbi:dTDP-4-dehydrorhamnose reductase [Glaciimonas sp. GG7]